MGKGAAGQVAGGQQPPTPEGIDQLTSDALSQGQAWLARAWEWIATGDNWVVVGLGVGLYFFLAFLKSLVRGILCRGEASSAQVRHTLGRMAGKTNSLFLLAVSIYTAILIAFPESELRRYVGTALMVLFFIQIAIWASEFLTSLFSIYADRHADSHTTLANAEGLVKLFVFVGVWAAAVLLILDNLQFDVTALIAGLGVGGIAIGLAAQGIFRDLFASLSIILDKPFVVGDFIIFGEMMGTVEKTGLRTTRIRSLSGEQLVIPNADLTESRIRNYKRMNERRIVFHFGVTYQTPAAVLEDIPNIVRNVVENIAGTRFDRCHFQKYGASSLDFETVYFVLTPDYAAYMDVQQAINFTLFRTFEERGIDFAYPTQTVILNKGEDWQEQAPAGSGTSMA